MSRLGKKIDALAALDQQIKTKEMEVKKLEKKYAAQEAELMAYLADEGLESASGSRGDAVKLEEKEYLTIKNRPLLDKFIRKTGAFDLYQSRINSRAYKDRIDAGEKVPGIGIFRKSKLKLTRRKR